MLPLHLLINGYGLSIRTEYIFARKGYLEAYPMRLNIEPKHYESLPYLNLQMYKFSSIRYVV